MSSEGVNSGIVGMAGNFGIGKDGIWVLGNCGNVGFGRIGNAGVSKMWRAARLVVASDNARTKDRRKQ